MATEDINLQKTLRGIAAREREFAATGQFPPIEKGLHADGVPIEQIMDSPPAPGDKRPIKDRLAGMRRGEPQFGALPKAEYPEIEFRNAITEAPRLYPPAVEAAAMTVALAMKDPDSLKRAQDNFRTYGLDDIWEGFRRGLEQAETEDAQNRVVAQARMLAEESGINPDLLFKEGAGGREFVARAMVDDVTQVEANRDTSQASQVIKAVASEKQGPHTSEVTKRLLRFNALQSIKLGIEQTQWAQKHRDLLNSRAAEMDQPQWETAVEAVTDAFVPGPYTYFIQNIMADLTGTDPDRTKGFGTSKQDLRTLYVSLPGKQRLELIKDFISSSQKHGASYLFNDYTQWHIMAAVFNDDLILDMSSEDQFDQIIGDVISVADLAFAGALFKRFGGWAGDLFNAPSKALIAGNPDMASRQFWQWFNNTSSDELATRWLLSKEELAWSQLPKPGSNIKHEMVNMPDFVKAESTRIGPLQNKVLDIQNRSYQLVFEPGEIKTAVDVAMERINQATQAVHRPALSTLEVLPDGSGVTFQSMFGATSTHGFNTVEQAMNYARDLSPTLEGVEFFRPIGSQIVKMDDPFHNVKENGQFFFRVKTEELFSNADKAAWNGEPVLGGHWQGQWLGWASPFSSFLDPKLHDKFLGNVMRESAMNKTFSMIMNPFWDLKPTDRLVVADMWSRTAKYGRENPDAGNPSWDDLMVWFPNTTDAQKVGYNTIRETWNTMYFAVNATHRKEILRHQPGAVSAGNASGASYHGGIVSLEEMLAKANKGPLRDLDEGTIAVTKKGVADAAPAQARMVEAYNPDNGDTIFLSARDIEALYKNGGVVLKTLVALSSKSGSRRHHFIYLPKNTASNWATRPLDEFVSRFEAGYITPFYKDSVYIAKIEDIVEDGVRLKAQETLVGVVVSEKQADLFIQRYAIHNPDAKLIKKADSRLQDRDNVALDMDRMQLEGRLMFDNRTEGTLLGPYQTPAETHNPLESIQRATRMLSRQVAVEEMVRTQKVAFAATYQRLFDNPVHKLDSEQIAVALKKKMRSSTTEDRRAAVNAFGWWNFIRSMEGSMGTSSNMIKRFSLNVGQQVHHILHGTPLNRAGLGVARNTHLFQPVEMAKQLAFFTLIGARPFRQVALQAQQAMMLSMMNPKYVGRATTDALLALEGLRELGKMEATGVMKDWISYSTQRSALMGFTQPEYATVIAELDKSGIIDIIDQHLFTGRISARSTKTRETTIGRGLQFADNATRGAAVDMLMKYGFAKGESINTAQTWMSSLDKYMRENKIRPGKMTNDDWNKVSIRATRWALTMHRGDQATWQHGFLSNAAQFLQFQQKATLVSIGGLTNAVTLGKTAGSKSGLTNLGFTPAQATQFLGMGMAGWGTVGLGGMMFAEAIREFLAKDIREGRISQTGIDLITYGAFDFALNKSMQDLFNDPELNFAFAETFAPMAGLDQMYQRFYDAGMEASIFKTLLGPSAHPLTGIERAIGFGHAMARGDYSHLSDKEKLVEILHSIGDGLLLGYSDLLQVRAAQRTGLWLSAAGSGTGLEARRGELYLKGMFGVNTKERMDSYRYTKHQSLKKQDIKQIAKEFHSRMLREVEFYRSGGATNDEKYLAAIRTERILLEVLAPEERLAVLEEFIAIQQRNPRLSVGASIGDALSKGFVNADEYFRGQVLSGNLVQGEEQQILLDLWDRMVSNAEEAVEIRKETRADEEEFFEQRTGDK